MSIWIDSATRSMNGALRGMDDSQSRIWFGTDQKKIVSSLRALANDLEAVGTDGWEPDSSVLMTDWSLGERSLPCLFGKTHGHPKLPDNRPMFSSELFFLDRSAGYARSFSRWYRLGQSKE